MMMMRMLAMVMVYWKLKHFPQSSGRLFSSSQLRTIWLSLRHGPLTSQKEIYFNTRLFPI
eukprot:7110326-Karenia_brevis.AAC.1